MLNPIANLIPSEVEAQLIDEGFEIDEVVRRRWRQHAELILEWDAIVGLVSRQDRHRLSEHFVDSLSLARYVARFGKAGTWIDVGSGGGFPALPVAVLLPEQPLLLLERNAKKAGFLRKAVARLNLRRAEVIHGAFPQVLGSRQANVITARAVETPAKLGAGVNTVLAAGGVYLDQRPAADELFHVEQIDDVWTGRGWRRGVLRHARAVS